MKTAFLFALIATVTAFSPLTKTQRTSLVPRHMGYVPDGMSPEEYRRLLNKEKTEQSKKKFGAFGPQTFRSRSLQSFQQDLEKGQAGHLMPVFNAKEKVKKGQIRPEDVPYMQRGGSWDDSDIKGAKKKQWNETDKKYNQAGSRFRLDWSGTQQRTGPSAAQAAKKKGNEPPPKKRFGLF